MLSELYYIDYYILVFIYVRLVVRLLFFERCKRMTDKQLSHLQGVFVWLFDFFVKKNTKKKTACPRIEPLFTANRGSISNKQRLCFIPTEPLFFYSFPQSHLLHPRGVTQNNIISVLQPPIQPKYHHTVQNTPIPAKKDLHEQPFMHYLRSRIRQCMHNGDNPQSTTSK